MQSAGAAKDCIKRDAWKIVGALSLLVVLAGCTAHKADNGVSGGGSAGSPGSILRYPLTANPTTFDPALVRDGMTIDLLQQVFEGLIIWGEDNQIHPNLAEKWDVSADGKVYTFHLKSGVKFHNGREMTADDFKYSIERACLPELASPTTPDYLKDIVGAMDKYQRKAKEVSGVKALDAHTLQITLTSFKPYWLGNMTYPCAYVVCKEEIEKNKDDKGIARISEKMLNSITGTGPFQITEVHFGSQVSLKAFDGYHEGRPKLDGIVQPIVQDAAQRINKYVHGDLDYVTITPGDLDHINSDPKLKADLKSFPRAATWYIALNQDAENSPFKKLKVRQAFAAAIDKDEIIRIALQGQADRTDNILPPQIPGRNEHIQPIPYDPAKAKQLLAEAGYPDGKDFPTLTCSGRSDYPQVQKTMEIIEQQLKTNLNINIQPRPVEWALMLDETQAKSSLPMFHVRWGADYLDPQNFLSTLLHSSKYNGKTPDHPNNGQGYNNPEFDRLCDAADGEHDQAKRFAMYQQAEQIAVTDAPWIPLYFQRDLELVSPRVGTLRDSVFGHRPHVLTTVSR